MKTFKSIEEIDRYFNKKISKMERRYVKKRDRFVRRFEKKTIDGDGEREDNDQSKDTKKPKVPKSAMIDLIKRMEEVMSNPTYVGSRQSQKIIMWRSAINDGMFSYFVKMYDITDAHLKRIYYNHFNS